MRTELSFLMDLFLNEEVPIVIKKQVADRIREVEEGLVAKPIMQPILPRIELTPESQQFVAKQAPSMQRIMAANPDLIPVPAVAVTPAAAAALQQRAALINGAGNEKPEPGRKSPRKF